MISADWAPWSHFEPRGKFEVKGKLGFRWFDHVDSKY
jgi:hypothetical protein